MDNNNNKQRIGIEENCAEQIVGTSNENAEGTQEMSSFSMNNKNASEEIENKEQESTKKRINFVNWFLDSLDWFKRPELAQSSLPTSSLRFKQYCWPKLHGNKVKERIVRELTISRRLDDEGNWQTILEKDNNILPIPFYIKPPEYIIGFEKINFRFIDDRALQFVQNILPLFNEVKIQFRHDYVAYDVQISPIKRLMEMLAPKTKLEIREHHFNKFNRQFPDFILSLQSIYLDGMSMQTDMDLIVKWLTTPMEDGKPKMLEIYGVYYSQAKALINRVKTEFIHSTKPANFIIFMHCQLSEGEVRLMRKAHFKTENKATEEMLELQRKVPNKYFLVRHKNDTETTAKFDDLEKQFERKEETTIWI